MYIILKHSKSQQPIRRQLAHEIFWVVSCYVLCLRQGEAETKGQTVSEAPSTICFWSQVCFCFQYFDSYQLKSWVDCVQRDQCVHNCVLSSNLCKSSSSQSICDLFSTNDLLVILCCLSFISVFNHLNQVLSLLSSTMSFLTIVIFICTLLFFR